MAISNVTNEYSIPRGRVYFDRFDSAGNKTGERQLGNAPSFTLEIASEKAEHYSSETGLRQRDASIVLQVDRTATLTIDNMSLENVAMFFAGDLSTVNQAAVENIVENFEVKVGHIYQLGAATNPSGVRAVANVVVTDGAAGTPVTMTLGDDYELDAAMGRIKVIAGGLLSDGDSIEVTYDTTAVTSQRAATGATTEISGAFRCISDNASGVNRDFYMPSVTLSPNGSIPIIADGTDFTTMEFTLDVLKPTDAEALYIDGRPEAI